MTCNMHKKSWKREKEEKNKAPEKKLTCRCFYVQPWCPSEPNFKDGTGKLSLWLMLSLVGGKHLFEKNAGILLVRPELFPANDQG